MNLDLYFPTPIWWQDLNINNNELLEFCFASQVKDPDGRKISNVGGWQSNDFSPEDDIRLKPLVDSIFQSAKFCLDTYGFREGSCKLTIGNLWININTGKDVNMVHTHPTSFLSAVYYVKASKQSAPIVFYKDFAEDFAITAVAPVERHTQLSASTAKYPPKAGRLVMFPAWLPHSVLPSNEEENRISIAFNLRLQPC
jgi:uncharacterized protein (TIGR02466 family)